MVCAVGMTEKSYFSIAEDLAMSKKVSITLDDEILEFVDRLASNRSSFINTLLRKERQKIFMQELAAAYEEQSNDPDFQSEFAIWDVAVSDGFAGDEVDAR